VLAGGAVVAVADVDRDRARRVADGVPGGGARAHATGADLVRDEAVDAVLVASWGATHEAYVLACLAAGKPVFCEKPLATTQEACLRVVDAEVALGRRLVQVGFMRRYDPAYRALKEVVASGAIGAPLIAHSVHRNASVPPHYTSDMAINDTAVHDVDVMRWLLDDEVASAQVLVPRRNSRAGGLRDPLVVLLEMAGGAVVDVEVSVNIAYGYDIRGEISGETGTASLAEGNPVVVRREGAFSGRVPEDWRERFARAYDLEFVDWLAAAARGTAAGPTAWDGYAATAACDAALEALRTGARTPVRLRERPDFYARA
jgi:myo-inositol 2-dehydrogenase / D-chiro-inositol 1-dehydrogenase